MGGFAQFYIIQKKAGNLFWLGTCIAIAGMVVLVGVQHVLALQLNAGILLALLASLFYAIYILITKGVLQNISTLTFMFYNMLSGSVFLFIINMAQHNNLVRFTMQPGYILLVLR